jgi:hypothetical protein
LPILKWTILNFRRPIGSGFMVGLVLAFSDTRKEVPHSLKKGKKKHKNNLICNWNISMSIMLKKEGRKKNMLIDI